jgi:hypothetical protein
LLRQIQERSPNVWHAGFLDRDRREYLTTLKEWAPEHPTLIIVDYASEFAEELEAVGRYLREMERGTEAHPYRLRVLLLERTADAQQGWFHSLRLAAAEADKLVPNPIRLQEETFGVLEREALFQHGLKVFAHHRGEPSLDTTGVKLDPLLSPDAFRDPLVILMAAAVSQERKNLNALALNRVDLAKEIAKHEEGRLSRLGGDRKKLLLHMAGFVTLTGKLARTQLMDACAAEIDAVQKRSPWTADELADVLQDAGLPSTENDWAVEPITPDIVGEAFVLNAWRQLRQPPEAAVLRAARASAGMVTRTLVRMVQDFADEEQVWAVQQLSAMLQDRAAGITDVDFWEIQAALPLDTVLMREPARDFYASVARARDGQRDQVSLTAQEQFAIREAMLGHPEIALRSMTEVVEIRRRVVREKDSEPTRAALASSLNNQASQQSEMGQRGAALATIEEAVIHYRKLAAAERETFLPNLAKALNNLSTHQSKMGQRGAALATIEEAVQYRRELVAADREGFLPNLATALNNRGHRQSEMGQLAEALVSIEEAVRHHRELVAANREAFLPDLARAINSLANLQGNMGQRAEALASIEEAVRHYCELAAAHPEAFLPYLATSHGAWGQILQDAGDAAAASEKFAEGVRMMTPLAQQLPQAHFELTLRLASAYEKACEEADLLPDPEITWPLEVMRQLQEEQNKPESE